MYCPKCKISYHITKTIINFQNLPVDEEVEGEYCPVCGYHIKNNIATIVNTNIYDIVTRYTNCTVEVLENSVTGDISVGWKRTEATEEMREQG